MANIISEFDVDDDFGYLGTDRFIQFAKQIETIIKRSKTPLCIGEIRRALGENDKRDWICNALEYLCADSTIREFQCGAMQRYEPATRLEPAKKKSKKEWASTLSISPRNLTFADSGVADMREAYARTA